MARSEVEVVALVEAVREHRHFRQLACYSIDALSKQLAPPNSRWREYVDLAIENSAAEVIIDVLALHPDEDVLARATACLSRLAVNSTNAKVITDLNTPWAESETCTECGKCVQVCPTGALFKKSRAVGEMVKDNRFLPYLKTMREVDNGQ